MDLVSVIMGSPALQAALIGAAVKMVVDFVKPMLKKVDENGLPDGYKMPVHMMVVVCSMLASVGDLAAKGQLSTLDPSTMINFLTIALPTMISALGVQNASTAVLVKTLGRETIKPVK